MESRPGKSHLVGPTTETKAFLKRSKPSANNMHFPWYWVVIPRSKDDKDGALKPADEQSLESRVEFMQQGQVLVETLTQDCKHIAATAPVRGNKKTGAKSQKELREIEHAKFNDQVAALAKKSNLLTGKWLLYPTAENVDAIWAKLVNAIAKPDGALAKTGSVHTAKVSTHAEEGQSVTFVPRASAFSYETERWILLRTLRRGYVICVYCDDSWDRDGVGKAFKCLVRDLGLISSAYKSDANTLLGIDSKHSSGIRSSLYGKTDFMTKDEIDQAIEARKEATEAPIKVPKRLEKEEEQDGFVTDEDSEADEPKAKKQKVPNSAVIRLRARVPPQNHYLASTLANERSRRSSSMSTTSAATAAAGQGKPPKGKGKAFRRTNGDDNDSDDDALLLDDDEDDEDMIDAADDDDDDDDDRDLDPRSSTQLTGKRKRRNMDPSLMESRKGGIKIVGGGIGDPRGSGRGGAAARSRMTKSKKGKGKAWEGEFEHTWDNVQEDERGTLEGAVSGALLGSKNRRILRDTTSIQRGIIRHVYLVIDLSAAMLEREFKSSWLDLTLQYAREFISEFSDQNPISQMALLVTRDGAAERLSPLGGNPVDHLKALQNKKKLEARGVPSLQNVLKMAQSGLSHLPPHGSREVIIILGSLTTCDPGNIHTTIKDVEKDRIRVNIIGLSAEMKICRDIATRTKGTYNVARDDLYLRELLFEFVSPPATLAPSKSHVLGGPSASAPTSSADLMQMGFPQLVQALYPGLCSCHLKLKTSGYICPRCKSRICDVPTECRVCGLTVVNAPQLARSYRHLFPLNKKAWGMYYRSRTTRSSPSECICGRLMLCAPKLILFAPIPLRCRPSSSYPLACKACSHPFPTTAIKSLLASADISPLGRYSCPTCEQHFCLDCDKLVHDALGFCPGCC
ncbi:BQ2448_7343 [Microbotryum intermedium]|uniref:BQ2448_7343 protein n=1 Tax=Microbotryum intermedium TaxID=269621 RepID=A0A238FJJ8_9BASI|nr:BQ2448_7343 [Microbotryum intermedium]